MYGPNKYHRLCHLIIWCFVVVSTTMSQYDRLTWTQHEVYSVATEFVKVSKSLNAAEASLKIYHGGEPTPQEVVIHDHIKTAKTSLVSEKEKVDHVINHNKLLQQYVRVLEQKVQEQTAMIRAQRVKWYKLRFKDRDRELMEINRKAMMMLVCDDVTKRMSANEVNKANARALELFNRCKTGPSTVDEVTSKKRKLKVTENK